ncbi:MAG: hypothetical protein M3273_01420 [Actinomycetota bacterium]|nr:hypothetical protein [Actinomycetota bacterium]
MKKTITALLLCVSLAAFAGPAGAAKGGLKTLGTDPAGDGPPGLDVTYLQVGRNAANLEIRIGLQMAPQIAGYPDLPGIEWVFDVNGHTYVAEAVKTTSGADFYLFEIVDGGARQLESPTGTYVGADGYTSILVPLKNIGARSGTVIAGTRGLENGDVDAHVHVGTITHYPDGMETTKGYVVP